MHNDYDDGKRSREFFENRVPDEQLRIAERTRKLIKEEVGTYVEHVAASKNPGQSEAKVATRASKLAFLAIPVQWVPAGDDEQAEAAFFKINQAATPIDPTELRILKARKAGNAVAARAITRGGTGHKYWASFSTDAKAQIARLGQEIYTALYEPPLETPIKTLDLPVAGRGYGTLPFVFDLVNSANNIRADSTKKKAKEIVVPDADGSTTVEYLGSVLSAVSRITGINPASLGLHPAVYFYTLGGQFQPSAFLATSEFLKDLQGEEKLRAFTGIRADFEESQNPTRATAAKAPTTGDGIARPLNPHHAANQSYAAIAAEMVAPIMY